MSLTLCWEALAKTLDKAFGCDAFLALLQNVKDNRAKVVTLVQAILAQQASHGDMVGTSTLPEPLTSAVERMSRVCLCVLCLASPIPGDMNSSPSDVEHVLRYKEDNTLLLYVQNLLKQSEIWTKLFDEVLAKHSSGSTVWPEVQRLATGLAKKPVESEFVIESTQKLTAFKKATRAGALDTFEATLMGALHSVADH